MARKPKKSRIDKKVAAALVTAAAAAAVTAIAAGRIRKSRTIKKASSQMVEYGNRTRGAKRKGKNPR
jgi:hypothetical protein